MTPTGPLHPARSLGPPLLAGRIRAEPDDFVVTERLGFEPSGDGEHDFLLIRKTGANTAWVARQLARHAGIPPRDVGYSGLKDRHAVSTQSFSVRRPNRDGTDWQSFAADGVEILEVGRHERKLRRGAHRGNAFRILLRGGDYAAREAEIDARLQQISAAGVPNYFGPQRFGRAGANLELARALFAGRRMSRDRRSIALSAARAFLFNAILSARVDDGSWNRVLPGERVNLDGTGSIFPADGEDLRARLDALDVHPSGTLWGRGAPLGDQAVGALENAVVAAWPELCAGLIDAGADAAARPLRVRVSGLLGSVCEQGLWLQFELPAGSFATAVLSELAAVTDAAASA